MHRHLLDRRLLRGLSFFVLGVLLSALALGVLTPVIQVFSLKRETALVAGTKIASLQRERDILRANTVSELAFLQSRLPAEEEQIDMYVLSTTSGAPRFVRTIDVLASALSVTGSTLTIDRIQFDQPRSGSGITRTRGHLILRGSLSQVATLMQILDRSGQLSLRDVLSPEEESQFLDLIQQYAPQNLRSAADALYMDISNIVHLRSVLEDSLFRDMGPEGVATVQAFLLQHGLLELTSTFDRVAPSLRATKLWPMPYTRIVHLEQQGEQWVLDIDLFGREH